MANALGATVTDFHTLPRSAVEESWMDVRAAAFEVRREVGRAYQARQLGRDPIPHLLNADRRLMRLEEYGRRHAGEAAGLTYISPDQLALFDGCLPGDDRGA